MGASMVSAMAWAESPAQSLLVHLSSPSLSAWGASKDDQQLGQVLILLSQTESGRDLLRRAQKAFRLPTDERSEDRSLPRLDQNTWKSVVVWDHVSRTDAVLTRHFDSTTGEELRERQVSVHLKRGQSYSDLFFDLSHELTHAVAGPNWDPYDPQLTASRYVISALEAPGGEIDAIFVECKLAFEVAGNAGALGKEWSAHGLRCSRYLSNSQMDRNKIKAEFYRVGRWYSDLASELGEEKDFLPLLSGDSPKLYSSTGGAPYPVALVREYQEINMAACANSKKRLSSVTEANRRPAGTADSGEEYSSAISDQIRGKTEAFLRLRCAAPKS
ncbi:MAG: hypothetical protein JNL01_09655 [Bdellovibrionales bacterium]|nr:hypothetical protein [Bdellovibrionales bacterium]